MGVRNMSLRFSSSLDKLAAANSSFDKGVLRVCYVGKNRNNSFIGKETFERCMPSIYNCPIVCRYDRETDEIGSHDMELVTDSKGNLSLVNLTTPVGVVPESAKYWWEEVEEDDGSIHEYLFVEVLLWKRQEAYGKIKEDGITDESMEITVLDGKMKDGVYNIDWFEFTAFCLLGTAEPCYESASLMTFSKEEFRAQFDEMMRELKQSYSLVKPSQEVSIHSKNDLEGGDEALDEKIALAVEKPVEELEAIEAESEAEVVDEPAEEPVEDTSENFALAEQFREELIEALGAEKVETCFGEMSRYWYTDYDGSAMEVYCYDQEDWKLYGFSYSMNGDHVVIDFASKKRKKCAIVDFDEGEQDSVFGAAFSVMSAKFADSEHEWTEKYQQAADAVEQMKAELDELRRFKSDTEGAIAEQERDELFAQFDDLAGVPAFDELRENGARYSLDELEEKCYALRGRKHSEKFALQAQKTPKLPIEKTSDIGNMSNEPYGGVFVKYGVARD